MATTIVTFDYGTYEGIPCVEATDVLTTDFAYGTYEGFPLAHPQSGIAPSGPAFSQLMRHRKYWNGTNFVIPTPGPLTLSG